MKKTISLLLVVLALAALLGGCGGGSGAASTTEAGKTEGNGISSNHIHCICNGKAVNVGEHKACSNNDGWVEISTAAELTDAIAGSSVKKPAYVVLTADITIDGYLEVALGKAVNICLNGKKLNASAAVIGEMNITDCTDTGSMVGDKSFTIRTYAGAVVNVYAGTITTTGSKSDTQVVVLQGAADEALKLRAKEAVFTLYNGTIRAVGKTTNMGHNVCIGRYGVLKMYNGTIRDGYVNTRDIINRYGGNIAVYGSNGAFYMYGGEVKDGTVVRSSGTNFDGGVGGNIFVYRGALYVSGGTISGGRASGYGGNIASNNVPQALELRNCIIKDGVAEGSCGGNLYINGAGEHMLVENVSVSGGRATDQGGNIFLNFAKQVTFKDCTISDGKSASGGGLAVQGKEFDVALVGDIKFENNGNSDILMLYYSAGTQSRLSVSKLTTTSPIVVRCKRKMTFTVDTVANHPFVAVEGMHVFEENKKLVIDVNKSGAPG